MRWLGILSIISILFLPVLVAAYTGGPDDYGYEFIDSQEEDGPEFNWIDISETGTEMTALYNFGREIGPIAIPFDFNFYGEDYDEIWICSHLFMTFSDDQGTSSNNLTIPTNTIPNNGVFLYWDIMWPNWQGNEPLAFYGEDENDNFVIQFNNWYSEYGGIVSAEVILYPNGNILFQYLENTIRGGATRESVGIENSNGSVGLEIAYNQDPANYPFDSLAILITPPDLSASVEGTVSDFHTGDPIENAIVRYLDHGDYEATTDEDGSYSFEAMLPGDYTVEIDADGFVSIEETNIEIEEDDENVHDFELRYPASLWFDPEDFDVRIFAGQVDDSHILTIRNDGGVDLEWDITCNDDWLSVDIEEGVLEPEEEIEIIAYFDATDMDIGDYETTMTILTNDPENLEIEIPASMLVDYEPPASFNLMEPEDQVVFIYEEQEEIQFAWEFAIDPDPFGMPVYNLFVQAVVDGNIWETIQINNIENVSYTFDVIDTLELEYWEDSLMVEWWVRAVAEPDTVQCEQSFTFCFEPNSGVLGNTNSELPEEFAISKVYPNPFNSTVNIIVAVPVSSESRVQVVDILGRQVTMLQHGQIEPGYHQIYWEAKNHPSGLYFLHFSTNKGFSDIKKMIYLR
ncbi:MAG: carboxypeptidase regulatory-like domain-containing protein [Candidatus Electryonea clarkiae]|nr:carboxypeptidase regulatory-like domain-containing protein [Candidatus Electryonea clarkiae]MDP8287903.1 carboxypeptidase regulatory-like domain-containing protein [Candidatus Electryonea clarkiae]